MTEQEYREIKVSPIQLIIIFLGLIIMGVIIFLLGISVGKKQAQLQRVPREIVSEGKTEKFTKKTIQEKKISEKTKSEKSEINLPLKHENLYYIQVGAFTSRARASTVANKFIELGYNAFVLEPFVGDKSPIYRVRIGGFSSQEEAVRIKEKLESMGKKKFLIVKQ